MSSDGLNAEPVIYQLADEKRSAAEHAQEADPDERDPVDSLEIFDLIRDIKDPEHPNTLEQLNVAQRQLITVDDGRGRVEVTFTPTIPCAPTLTSPVPAVLGVKSTPTFHRAAGTAAWRRSSACASG